jgi:hypothetical protein
VLEIKGETAADYFNIVCTKCGGLTQNEYLGWDPSVPHFRATCKRCKTSGTWKLDMPLWKGLPSKPEAI